MDLGLPAKSPVPINNEIDVKNQLTFILGEKDKVFYYQKEAKHLTASDLQSVAQNDIPKVIEQYKNSEAANTFRSWFTDDAIRFQEALFTEMMRQGYFKKGPAHTIALQFYAPFFLLLCQYDTMPEKEAEALGLLMAHIDQFAAVYQTPSEETK